MSKIRVRLVFSARKKRSGHDPNSDDDDEKSEGLVFGDLVRHTYEQYLYEVEVIYSRPLY